MTTIIVLLVLAAFFSAYTANAAPDCSYAPWTTFRKDLLSHQSVLVAKVQNLTNLKMLPSDVAPIVARSNGNILSILGGITKLPANAFHNTDINRTGDYATSLHARSVHLVEIMVGISRMMKESGITDWELETFGCGPVTVGGPPGYPTDGTLSCPVTLSNKKPHTDCSILRCTCDNSGDKTVLNVGLGMHAMADVIECLSALH